MRIERTSDGTVYKIPEHKKDENLNPTVVIKQQPTPIHKTVTFKIAIFLWIWGVFQFLIAPLVGYPLGSEKWIQLFALSSENLTYYWTWFTSMISHGGFIHLLVNSIVLVSFGREVESDMSKLNYLLFFIGVGLLSGLTQVLLVHYFATEPIVLVGSSGAISGIIGYVGIKRPKQTVYFLFVIKMKLRTAMALFMGVSVGAVLLYGFGAGGFGHMAHLSGFILGVIYAVSQIGISKDVVPLLS